MARAITLEENTSMYAPKHAALQLLATLAALRASAQLINTVGTLARALAGPELATSTDRVAEVLQQILSALESSDTETLLLLLAETEVLVGSLVQTSRPMQQLQSRVAARIDDAGNADTERTGTFVNPRRA